jgi:hypothetical protein
MALGWARRQVLHVIQSTGLFGVQLWRPVTDLAARLVTARVLAIKASVLLFPRGSGVVELEPALLESCCAFFRGDEWV